MRRDFEYEVTVSFIAQAVSRGRRSPGAVDAPLKSIARDTTVDCDMSKDAIASWLRVRQYTSVARKFLKTSDESNLYSGNAALCLPKSAQPLQHHRIFWTEETTSASLREGMQRAIEGEKQPAPQTSEDFQQPGPASSAVTSIKNQTKTKRLSPADTVRAISRASDLLRLAQTLNQGRIDTCCRTTFTAALRDGNPAIVDMWLRHGKQHGGSCFLEAFRSWGKGVDVAGQNKIGSQRPPCIPLHLSCHSGSLEIVSVLLQFMADSYSSKDCRAMINARDSNGRTALHLSSWSPRPQCPGKRNTITRCLLAHGADVNAKDNHGRTSLHWACRTADRFAVEILLKAGANPMHEDDRSLTSLETVSGRRYRRLLDAVLRKHASKKLYLQLRARIAAKAAVKSIMHHFVPVCDTCRVRPAGTCDTLKRNNFAAWLYKHQRWPKAGEGKWKEVRSSCVENVD